MKFVGRVLHPDMNASLLLGARHRGGGGGGAPFPPLALAVSSVRRGRKGKEDYLLATVADVFSKADADERDKFIVVVGIMDAGKENSIIINVAVHTYNYTVHSTTTTVGLRYLVVLAVDNVSQT